MGKIRKSPLLLPLVVVAGVCAMVAAAARSPIGHDPVVANPNLPQVDDAVQQVDQFLQTRWTDDGLTSALEVDELQLLRRLSLSLHGTIPSLEEIRQFESDTEPDRIDRWTVRMLSDQRFGDYFAERLTRVFVGTEEGQFILFRRDQFTRWLSDALMDNRPYNDLVTEILTKEGLWTGSPATNFVTAAIANDDLDENKLTAKTVRAFLGQRIDCAQCHDDFFGSWTQSDFEGLAAFYGQTTFSILGIEDKPIKDGQPVEYRIADPGAEMEMMAEEGESDEPPPGRVIEPKVPFHPEWVPAEGSRRQQLAAWVTHADNRRFERATVNRVWGLLFGRPWYGPVDGLPDPPEDPADADVLDILGQRFRDSGYDLKQLIRTIVQTKAFRIGSEFEADEDAYDAAEQSWAVFPLVRLRPDQVIGSLLQSKFIKTIDRNSHYIVRLERFFSELDFIREYGDAGDEELTEEAATIQQALLKMNGEVTHKVAEGSPFTAAPQILSLSQDDKQVVENCFLVCLSRRPTAEELDHFVQQFDTAETKDERTSVVQDLYWSLMNSPEFSWNH